MSNVNEEDLFAGFEEEEGITVQTEPVKVEEQEEELTKEEVQEVEAAAIAGQAEQIQEPGSIDAFIEQQRVPTEAELKKQKKQKPAGDTATAGTVPKTPPAPPKPKYTGPRVVMVYGNELFTEENPDVTNEEIRQRIVDEFAYPEFSKDRTTFSLDEDTGIFVPGIKFEKKG